MEGEFERKQVIKIGEGMENHPDLVVDGINNIIEHSGILSGDNIRQISDGHHTFKELYDFRLLYNANLFNLWSMLDRFDVHKSLKHNDGEDCFDGGWFIVVAILPTGQISNHYRLEHWDLFKVPEEYVAKYAYDGHTPQDVLHRMRHVIEGDYLSEQEQ